MIITFATQKGGVGKTTLSIAFANYISVNSNRKVTVYDFDFQKSFYNKWKEDELANLPVLYEVKVVDEDKSIKIDELDTFIEMSESDDINIFDLAGTLDAKYVDILTYSNFIVIPFEYSDVSAKSTLVFINLLGIIESQSERIFIRSKYDKGYNYLNQEGMDIEISKYGKVIKNPIYKRNSLQTINTRKLTYDQLMAIKNPFNELIDYINETSQITL